jgi:hypothetical protein
MGSHAARGDASFRIAVLGISPHFLKAPVPDPGFSLGNSK